MPGFRIFPVTCCVALTLAMAACGGRGAQGGGDTDTDSGGTDTGGPEDCAAGRTPDFTPLRRMTRAQYDNTVRALFGDGVTPGPSFPVSTRDGGFSSDQNVNVVTEFGAQGIFDAAEFVAGQVVQDLPAFLPCAASNLDAACVSGFVADFGERAFRRPLSDEERAIFEALDGQAPPDATAQERIGALLEAFLQAPQFLYITQGGGEPSEETDHEGRPLLALTDHEIAARLSYLLWDTMPDGPLWAKAEAGELSSASQVEEAARQMLADPRADPVLARFHAEWLAIENVPTANKDEDVFPGFDADLAAAMLEESRRFALAVVRDGGSFADLLTGKQTQVTAALAGHYGVPAPTPGPDGFGPVMLPEGRAGLLTQAAFLTAHSHVRDTGPVIRGAFVQRELLCAEIPPPPPGVDTNLPPAQPGQTMREVLEAHRADPSCAGCHNLVDPPGLAFENFDAVGQWRDFEGGVSIDASGELVSQGGSIGTFTTAEEMAGLLAGADRALHCYAQQWLHFGQGAAPGPAQSCVTNSLGEAFVENGGSIEELLIHVVQTDTFRFRLAPQN